MPSTVSFFLQMRSAHGKEASAEPSEVHLNLNLTRFYDWKLSHANACALKTLNVVASSIRDDTAISYFNLCRLLPRANAYTGRSLLRLMLLLSATIV